MRSIDPPSLSLLLLTLIIGSATVTALPQHRHRPLPPSSPPSPPPPPPPPPPQQQKHNFGHSHHLLPTLQRAAPTHVPVFAAPPTPGPIVFYPDAYRFSLDNVAIEPAPKPLFLMNATYEVIDQFMGIYKTPGIGQLRKVNELDILVGTLRPEVQSAYQQFKSEAILQKLTQEEKLGELTEKAHYTLAHLEALKASRTIGQNERKKRIELIFSEFSDFLVSTITDEMGNVVDAVMRQMLRAVLFTEHMTMKLRA